MYVDPVEEIRDNPSLMEYKDPEPVGLELVIRVNKDPASPLSSFKCTLCNCFFNDDNAKMMHCKGRRHRTNFKVSCVCWLSVCSDTSDAG